MASYRSVLLSVLILTVSLLAAPDEGMWLYNAPPRALLKQRYGFEPTQPWLERLQKSCISQVVVTNTIPLRGKEQACPKLHQLSVAPLLGEAIRRIHEAKSVSSLFV